MNSKDLKGRLTTGLLTDVLVVLGAASIVAGVGVQWGLGFALIVGGVAAIAVALLIALSSAASANNDAA